MADARRIGSLDLVRSSAMILMAIELGECRDEMARILNDDIAEQRAALERPSRLRVLEEQWRFFLTQCIKIQCA